MSEEYDGYTVVVIPKEKQKPKLKKPAIPFPFL